MSGNIGQRHRSHMRKCFIICVITPDGGCGGGGCHPFYFFLHCRCQNMWGIGWRVASISESPPPASRGERREGTISIFIPPFPREMRQKGERKRKKPLGFLRIFILKSGETGVCTYAIYYSVNCDHLAKPYHMFAGTSYTLKTTRQGRGGC